MKKVFNVGIKKDNEELFYLSHKLDNGEVYVDFTPLRTKAHHYKYKNDARMVKDFLLAHGYDSFIEDFYTINLELQ